MKRVYIISLLLLPFIAYSQGIKKANKKLTRGEYEEAIARYEKLLDNPKYTGEANFEIAEAYRLSNRIKMAKPFYEAAIAKGYRGEEAYFWLAFAKKADGDYQGAQKQIEHYLNIGKDEKLIARAEKELDNIMEIVLLDEKESYYRVKNLDVLNTQYSEYSPVYQDGKLFFTSNRFGGKIYGATGTPFTNIYVAETKGARVNTETIRLLGDINSSNANDGTIAFSPDGRTIVFAKGNTGKRKGTADVNLYVSRYRNKSWSEPRMLSISRPDTWDSSPCFSRDGRTIYFSSLRDDPDAQGGLDLYSARMDPRGRFGQVKNLGPDINTPGDEMFPYVSSDGYLYFSSTGHPGYGGLDIFVAKRKGGKVNVENLGKPMNSSSDDFGINLFKADRGFFTSNRPDGKGDDDIWTFVNDDPNLKTVNYFLEGITKTHDDEKNTERILSNVRVMLIDYQQNILDEMVVGKDGKFKFRVYENENYELMAEKQGSDADDFYVTRLNYTTIGKSVPQEELVDLITEVTFDTVMYLDKIILEKSIVLENIYYEFAKWDITPVAAQELDRLVDILVDNPDIIIELSSHTDSVDTESYNMRLSQRRAESAVNYIIQAGISPDRLIAKGYGESMPIAPNSKPDGSDNPEGRAKNRRTEFKVIRITNSGNKKDAFDEDKYFKDDGDG